MWNLIIETFPSSRSRFPPRQLPWWDFHHVTSPQQRCWEWGKIGSLILVFSVNFHSEIEDALTLSCGTPQISIDYYESSCKEEVYTFSLFFFFASTIHSYNVAGLCVVGSISTICTCRAAWSWNLKIMKSIYTFRTALAAKHHHSVT